MSEERDSYLWGTTYEAVVRPAGDFRDLLEKLYDFGLNQSLALPRAADERHLRDALGDFIARFMEATAEALDENPGLSELDCARDILRKLRRPQDKARVHRKAGLRRRLKELVLRELGAAPAIIDEPEARLAAPKGEDTSPAAPGLADIPAPFLAEIRSELERAWSAVLRRALPRVLKHSKPQGRRRAIAEILAERARRGADSGVIADHLEAALAAAKPAEIIAELRASGHAPQRGRRKVQDPQLRRDIRLVKEAFQAELAPLKHAERHLRAHLAGRWAAHRLKLFLDQDPP